MFFDLRDDQKELQRTVHALLSARLPEGERTRSYDATSLDRDLWRELTEMGLTGILTPEDKGGLGLDLLTLAATCEVLGAFGAPAPVASTALAAWALSKADEAAAAVWPARMAAGEAVAAFAFSEGGRGWLPEDWTFDETVGGRKQSVTWGAEADTFVVGLAGGALGVADARAEGVTVTPADSLDRTQPMATIDFAPGAVTRLGQSAQTGQRLRDALLVVLAADAYGAAKHAFDMAVDYARVRHQFGRPIGSFQAIKHQLANIAVELEPCRPLYWYAAHAWDAIPDEASRSAAIAKSHITDVAVRTARAAVEAHGGIGYTWEYPLHIFLKRAMHDRAVMGLPAQHQDRAAAMAGW